MPYSADFEASLRTVEATRPERLGQKHAPLGSQDKAAILKAHHPDCRDDSTRAVRVGPNRGERMLSELADVLERRPLVRGGEADPAMPDFEADVLVIGGGGAGCAAALEASKAGASVILATKLRLGDANTVMAQGGIQAADKENDSPMLHYLDVMGGGGFSNDPNLVERLVLDAPGVVLWLESFGCIFDKEPGGAMRTGHGGGTCRKRMHAARDYTGAEIMRVLRDEVRSRKIRVLEFMPAIELLTSGGRIAGAVLMNFSTNRYSTAKAGAVILATGGSGRLHYRGFPTSNHYGATADGLVLAYRAGVRLRFADTMQYHPTGAAFPQQILGLLVTEKVRSLGAQLVNREGRQFINSLETRDVVASAIIRECGERGMGVATPAGKTGVWLDAPMIEALHGKGSVKRDLPAMTRQFERYGIDIAREPILVYPTVHYQNGGLAIDSDGRTSVPGLYAAGEATGGVHGRNRLMGNSLLDILVFGRRSGAAAAEYGRANRPAQAGLDHLREWNLGLDEAGIDGGATSPMLLPDYRRVP